MASFTPAIATPRRFGLTNTRWALLALLLIAFLIRWPSFGNPTYKLDEQFYLFVGDRLRHGALPYVDVWDRKPIGLFLIYAAIRLLGGSGFVQYQLVATLFAGATAGCIFLLARRFAGYAGGLFGGAAYLLWIEMAEGGGGQAPVFYNLPMAAAALMTFQAIAAPDRSVLRRRAFAAMALAGVAIQIKYTALIEGFYFGLLLAWQLWRRSARSIDALTETALLALTALAPTMLALGFYTAIGHGREFWFANFTSIFHRGEAPAGALAVRLQKHAMRVGPLLCCGLIGAWYLRRDRAAWPWLALLVGWLIAAFVGFLSVGALYPHYVLPVFVPLCVAAALCMRRWPTGGVIGLMTLYLPASILQYPFVVETSNGRHQIEALAALVPPDVRTGCMQIFAGPPSLYLVTGACTRTRFPFPDHLTLEMERDAIGTDQAAELSRLLASKPRVIVTSHAPADPPLPNPISLALIDRALAKDYRLAGTVPVDGRETEVYVSR